MAAGDGLVIMTPTSITHAGTSASINADGGVDFTAATSLSLNGVFTSAHDNYLVVCIVDSSSGGDGFSFRLRAAGTDASGSDYTRQYVRAGGAGGTTVDAARNTSLSSGAFAITGTEWYGFHAHFYGPYLTQPTAIRSVTMESYNTAEIQDYANTHSLSTSYDGFTITGMGTGTGNIVVFGYEE